MQPSPSAPLSVDDPVANAAQPVAHSSEPYGIDPPLSKERGELLSWLHNLQRHSQFLLAVIEPMSLTVRFANDYFWQLFGLEIPRSAAHDTNTGNLEGVLGRLLTETDRLAVTHLYHRHLLHLVCRDLAGVNLQQCRLLDEPIMVCLQSPLYEEPRYIELRLRSQQLTIVPSTENHAETPEWLAKPAAELEKMLSNPIQVQQLEQQLRPELYQVRGKLLLEGLDVTIRESIRRITQLLIDRDSVLHAQKFYQVNQQMRSLFRACNTVILSVEVDQVRVFMGSLGEELDVSSYSMESMKQSHVTQALQANRVTTISDLAEQQRTEFGHKLADQGVRSLLLIPLVSQFTGSTTTTRSDTEDTRYCQVVGLVGVLSDRPHNFDGLDCSHAEQLIPAFTAALTSAQRQLVQQRFITNIHPAVEWRFLQEAERRSLGLPAEPIVFTSVHPLYGISDIRGSSEERNRAIQADLLEQLGLGLAVVEAACKEQPSALAEQLRLDLLERIQKLQAKITVEAEVGEIRYLRNHLEIYFDYFAQCGEGAIAAIAAYQEACTNEPNCVYRARAQYDQAIARINGLLRETWERWQTQMQRISSHYCDLETTDGIDHMIYAGKSIDPKFGSFQLRSLRYEQLRAVCDCARTALRFQATQDTTMRVTHLILVQDSTVDIFHDETTEKLFDVRGTRDTRYEIVKKRIDKAIDEQTQARITQPGMLTLVYSTNEELEEYQQYLRYLAREGWVDTTLESGTVEPLQGVTGLRFVRVRILLPEENASTQS